MNKPVILLYSDCFTFGGSEYVVINILKSKFLQSTFEFHFAYRNHKEYSFFVDKLLAGENNVTLHPLKIWSNGTIFHKINTYVKGEKTRCFLKFPLWFLAHVGPYEWNNKRVFRNLLTKSLSQIDLIHINNGGYPASESCLYFAICAGELGIKTIFQVNNRATIAKKNRRDGLVEDSVSLFLTATEYARKELASNRHFNIDKIVTLYNAVEIPKITKSKSDVCNEIGVSEDKYILTEVALLEDRKGQIPLLKSLLALQIHNKDLYDKTSIILIGNGENERIIKSFIQNRGLSDKVKMLGYRLDYVDIINASDVFILPSLFNEDMPLSILTAMALSKPVISSAIAGIPEEVVNNVNGYLVNPSSPSFEKDLAECIEKTYYNKDVLGINSYKRFQELFSRSIYDFKLMELYRKVINN